MSYLISASQGPDRAAKLILEISEAYGKSPVTDEEILEQGKTALKAFHTKMRAIEKNEGYALIASLHALAGVAEELKTQALKHAVMHWGLKHAEWRDSS